LERQTPNARDEPTKRPANISRAVAPASRRPFRPQAIRFACNIFNADLRRLRSGRSSDDGRDCAAASAELERIYTIEELSTRRRLQQHGKTPHVAHGTILHRIATSPEPTRSHIVCVISPFRCCRCLHPNNLFIAAKRTLPPTGAGRFAPGVWSGRVRSAGSNAFRVSTSTIHRRQFYGCDVKLVSTIKGLCYVSGDCGTM
jgi:hypothetical protein